MSLLLHILQIILASFLTTFLLMPFSPADTLIIATLNTQNIYLTILLLCIMDGFIGILAYKFSNVLIPKMLKKDKQKEQLKNVGKKLNKWGWWVVLIAAATPFPYTITLYAAGAVNWGNNFKIYSSVFIGKLLRYTTIAVITYFGLKIDFKSLFSNHLYEIIISIILLVVFTLEIIITKLKVRKLAII